MRKNTHTYSFLSKATPSIKFTLIDVSGYTTVLFLLKKQQGFYHIHSMDCHIPAATSTECLDRCRDNNCMQLCLDDNAIIKYFMYNFPKLDIFQPPIEYLRIIVFAKFQKLVDLMLIKFWSLKNESLQVAAMFNDISMVKHFWQRPGL